MVEPESSPHPLIMWVREFIFRLFTPPKKGEWIWGVIHVSLIMCIVQWSKSLLLQVSTMGGQEEACAKCNRNCLLIHKLGEARKVSSFFKVMFGKRFSEVLVWSLGRSLLFSFIHLRRGFHVSMQVKLFKDKSSYFTPFGFWDQWS